MRNLYSKLKLYTILFIFGGAGYCVLELIWSGHTHPAMALCGGVSLIFVYLTNDKLRGSNIVKQAFICAVFITTCELICGFIVNTILEMELWNYSAFSFNFMGQICIRYSIYWFGISFVALYVCRFFKKCLE